MSLFGAVSVGISGMQAQSDKLDLISTNVANVNTTGYKEGVESFADLISKDSAVGYSPNGVQASGALINSLQGNINSTTSPTDLAISGTGFFAVSPSPDKSGGVLYTRAGSFTQDTDGNLVNSAGFYLQGWKLDANGALPPAIDTATVASGPGVAALETVNAQQLNDAPIATTAVSLQVNLSASQVAYAGIPAYDPANVAANMASGAVAPQFTAPVTVVDSKGVNHDLTAGFLKTANNTWAVELYIQPASDVTGTSGQIAAGNVTFNGDGTLASVSPALSQPVAVNWSNGATASNITFGLGTAGQPFGTPGATLIGRSDGLSQFDEAFNIQNTQQNGIQAGTLLNIAITSDGFVQGKYSNGDTRNLYKIPLVNFTESNQLKALSGNVVEQTQDAGTATFSQPGESGSGKLQVDALESSNVDLSSQLTDMIVAQRSYQFNSKLVSTSDTMLTDLVSMGAT